MTDKKGALITFEGVEGSGKTTQASILFERLREMGNDVALFREPGSTETGEKIRRLLLQKGENPPSPMAELFLYGAARAQLVNEKIAPALKRGAVVICDRYADSSLAYQGMARSLGLEAVESINQLATSNLKADLTILLDCPPEVSLKRLRPAEEADRFHEEKMDFHTAVRYAYLFLAVKEPARFFVVDARKGVEELKETIFHRVQRFLNEFRRD